MKRAIIYCRISRDPEHTELGVKRQEKDCRALCEREGLEVAEVAVDDDRSAYSGKRRPGYERVLEVIQAGEVSVLVAWHPDRITRSPKELETLIDILERSKVTVRTVQAGEYDLATPTGRMTARVVGAVARGESEHKSARLRRKHQELAERGRNAGGGTRPFGFNEDRLTINAGEARRIQDAVSHLLAGGTVRSVAARWNEAGVASPGGTTWSPHVVRRLLMSGRIAGLREHSTGTYTAVWPAIITPEDHQRLVAILSDPARRKNGRPVRYLLTGYIVCSLCGARLVARPKADKRRCYVCASGPGFNGCGKIRTLSEPVEDLVTEAVLTRLDTPALAAAFVAAETTDEDGTTLARIDEQLAELGEMWAAGELDRVSWAAARRPLEEARERLGNEMRSQVATASAQQLAGDGLLRDRWPALDVEQRRTVIGAVVETVEIAPAVKGRNTFDPSRVSVRWRA